MNGLSIGRKKYESGIEKLCGCQFGPLNDVNEISGGQIGLVNDCDTCYGGQIGILNYIEELTGSQFGAINRTCFGDGVQFGVMNSCDVDFDGLQLGVLCRARDGNYLQLGLLTVRDGEEPWYRRVTLILGYHRR